MTDEYGFSFIRNVEKETFKLFFLDRKDKHISLKKKRKGFDKLWDPYMAEHDRLKCKILICKTPLPSLSYFFWQTEPVNHKLPEDKEAILNVLYTIIIIILLTLQTQSLTPKHTQKLTKFGMHVRSVEEFVKLKKNNHRKCQNVLFSMT